MKIVIKFNANKTLVVFDFEGFPIVGPFSLHYFGSGKGNIRDKIPLNEWWRKKTVVEQVYLSGSDCCLVPTLERDKTMLVSYRQDLR